MITKNVGNGYHQKNYFFCFRCFVLIQMKSSILHYRILLFLSLCIPSRLLLVYFSKVASISHLSILGYLALVVAVGFIVLFVTGWRKQGVETFGQPIWWNMLRPIHALFYFLFAYHAIVKKDTNNAWKFLLADVLVGLTSFMYHHHEHLVKLVM